MADFLLYALLAGLALALVAGPLGSFVLWRRMAYFGDTRSHAALLGVTMGFLLDVSPTIATFITLYYATNHWENAALCLSLFGASFISAPLARPLHLPPEARPAWIGGD